MRVSCMCCDEVWFVGSQSLALLEQRTGETCTRVRLSSRQSRAVFLGCWSGELRVEVTFFPKGRIQRIHRKHVYNYIYSFLYKIVSVAGIPVNKLNFTMLNVKNLPKKTPCFWSQDLCCFEELLSERRWAGPWRRRESGRQVWGVGHLGDEEQDPERGRGRHWMLLLHRMSQDPIRWNKTKYLFHRPQETLPHGFSKHPTETLRGLCWSHRKKSHTSPCGRAACRCRERSRAERSSWAGGVCSPPAWSEHTEHWAPGTENTDAGKMYWTVGREYLGCSEQKRTQPAGGVTPRAMLSSGSSGVGPGVCLALLGPWPGGLQPTSQACCRGSSRVAGFPHHSNTMHLQHAAHGPQVATYQVFWSWLQTPSHSGPNSESCPTCCKWEHTLSCKFLLP